MRQMNYIRVVHFTNEGLISLDIGPVVGRVSEKIGGNKVNRLRPGRVQCSYASVSYYGPTYPGTFFKCINCVRCFQLPSI